jgi:hypothetical protein
VTSLNRHCTPLGDAGRSRMGSVLCRNTSGLAADEKIIADMKGGAYTEGSLHKC